MGLVRDTSRSDSVFIVRLPRPCTCPKAGSAAVAALVAVAAAGAQQQPPRSAARVDVARIIVGARVLDAGGNPITGLSADDFKVRIDGKPVRVETATWVGARGIELEDALPLDATPR